MSEISPADKNELRKIIAIGYSRAEMKVLCEELGAKWENVSTEEAYRETFALNIVNYFERRGQIYELIEYVKEDRPNFFASSNNQESIVPNSYEENHYTPINTTSEGANSLVWIIAIALVIGAIFFVRSWYIGQKLRDPGEFITDYVKLLNNITTIDDAWDRLSGDYRVAKHPSGYTPFSFHWSSFRKIEILKLEVLAESETTASVEVFLTSTGVDNSIINQTIVYKLTRPTAEDAWLISDSDP